MDTSTKIKASELDHDTRLYLRHTVSDIRRGIVPPPTISGPKPSVVLDQILEGKRPRPREWPALIVIGRDGLREAA